MYYLIQFSHFVNYVNEETETQQGDRTHNLICVRWMRVRLMLGVAIVCKCEDKEHAIHRCVPPPSPVPGAKQGLHKHWSQA